LPEDAYERPELESVMDAVTFHLSFDRGSMRPDMAAGSNCFLRVTGSYDKQHAEPLFAPGLAGQALVLGTGGAIYRCGDSLPLGRQGAIALWVKPLEWQRPRGNNVVFMTSANAFYLQRQGPWQLENGKRTRSEMIQFLAKATRDQKRYTSLGSYGAWENGRWYFVAVNWAWPRMEFSVDGKAFSSKSLPGVPSPGMFGSFFVGSGGGDKALLDEVFGFRRCLSLDEVRLLYDLLRE
jgi:hypothetical protein